MKQLFFIGAILLTLLVSGESLAQNAQASEYMNTISTKYRTIQEGVWDYTSTVAHGKSAKKVESTRTSLIQTTFKVLNEVKKMPDFEGDAAYRDSVASFLNIYYLILKEDYAKIVDMEEISERSYNDMEAYMNAKEAANVKMNNAADMVAAQQRIFAEKHGITLVEAKDDLSENAVVVFDPADFDWKSEHFSKPVKLVSLPLKERIKYSLVTPTIVLVSRPSKIPTP